VCRGSPIDQDHRQGSWSLSRWRHRPRTRLAPTKTTTVKAMLHPASVISRTRMGHRVAFHGTAPVSAIAAGKIVAHPRIGQAIANLRAVRLAMRSTRRWRR
jgi:hypothetical protein